MQLNCLFWNTSLGTPDKEIVSLVSSTKANLLALAEYGGDSIGLISELGATGLCFYRIPTIGCKRIQMLTGFPPTKIVHKREADRYTIKEIAVPGMLRLLVCVAHLPSKLHSNDIDQLHTASFFKHEIELAEAEATHSNTIVFGDFNMNPFDDGMISAAAMNSIPCSLTAQRGFRTIEGRKHSFFYNPMWNLLGDFSGSPGTYFHTSPGYRSHYWNILDQVVLRPAVAARLSKPSLAVLTKAGKQSLVNKSGRPEVSDHLPIRFSVDITLGAQK